MKRRILPLSSLDADASPIAAALARWRAARPRSGRLPARGSFELSGLTELLDDSGWVAVTADRPARFRFHAAAPAASRGLRDLETISRHGGALRDAARPVYDDYAAAAFTGVPLLHHLLPADGGEAVERLILPFSNDGVGVDGLLVCARKRAEPALH
jgi:hypothetical protein